MPRQPKHTGGFEGIPLAEHPGFRGQWNPKVPPPVDDPDADPEADRARWLALTKRNFGKALQADTSGVFSVIRGLGDQVLVRDAPADPVVDAMVNRLAAVFPDLDGAVDDLGVPWSLVRRASRIAAAKLREHGHDTSSDVYQELLLSGSGCPLSCMSAARLMNKLAHAADAAEQNAVGILGFALFRVGMEFGILLGLERQARAQAGQGKAKPKPGWGNPPAPKSPLPTSATCTRCGGTFTPKRRPVAKYCPTCRKRHTKHTKRL